MNHPSAEQTTSVAMRELQLEFACTSHQEKVFPVRKTNCLISRSQTQVSMYFGGHQESDLPIRSKTGKQTQILEEANKTEMAISAWMQPNFPQGDDHFWLKNNT